VRRGYTALSRVRVSPGAAASAVRATLRRRRDDARGVDSFARRGRVFRVAIRCHIRAAALSTSPDQPGNANALQHER
jgi:hypothetical protein